MTTATTTMDATPAGRHLSGLNGVQTVQTKTFRRAQTLLGQAVTLNDLAAIAGPPGCGKTLAVDHFVHYHPVMATREWHWLQMPPKPATKEVTQRLLRSLGFTIDRRATQYELTEELSPALQGSGRVVVIDEAHHLKGEGLQQLRYLHDRGQNSWALILVGSDVDRTLGGAAELRSRVSAWVRFEPLAETELLRALQQWHPVLAELEPRVLLQVNRQHARGNWRYWAQFLRALLTLRDRSPGHTGDGDIVRAALTMVDRSTLGNDQ